MTLNLNVPTTAPDLSPRITVIGVGGAGGNAVNNMIQSNLDGVEFLITNTDAQALTQSLCERRIQLGRNITQGLGAGSRPDIGRAAAEEALDEILTDIEGQHMVFITAGMGGGTGTGAAPVIARAAREAGILTVGVVTKPFHFEGVHRMRLAESGINELTQYVDTLIIIPNQNLFRVANEKTTFADAFKMADDVLNSGVRGVTDLMVNPGMINLDFADIRAVMSEMGKAMMGTGEAEGEGRAIAAAEAAISNPLLDDVSMKGARGVLINITGGMDLTLFEVDEAANRIRDEVDPEANIIFGSTFDQSLEGMMRVSVVSTGIDVDAETRPKPITLSVVGGQKARHVENAPGAGSGAGAATASAAAGAPVAAEGGLFGQPSASLPSGGQPGSGFPASKYPLTGGTAMSAEPYAPATGHGATATAMAMPEPEMSPAPRAKAEEDSFIAPAPAEPEREETGEAGTLHAEPDPFAEAALANAARPERAEPRSEHGAEAAPRREPTAEARPEPRMEIREPRREAPRATTPAPRQSLFAKVTGAARALASTQGGDSAARPQQQAAPRPMAARSASPAQPERPSAAPNQATSGQPVAGQPAPAQPAAAQPAAAQPVGPAGSNTAQPRLSGLDPAERIGHSQAEEDLLDIPAFLRRQAN
ncbi:cell division protein FtsZ [Pelagibius marinus]|uniref:cell division protein FtsZ n=1 Tax=Pelagibius marinus TaxID=2762760 RepID=UPI0018729626|nr:cell division protein FtsZ [Pelagibius marinus]